MRTGMRTAIGGVVVLLRIVVLLSDARAATWYVDDDDPADFDRIQLAIDTAENGDTIIVADGTYTGEGNRDIDFKGKAITLRSENGPEDCIIDCQYAGRGFYFFQRDDDKNDGRVLDGFTVRNGWADEGGAIFVHYGSPLITNNIITQNTAEGFGGGIYCHQASSPSITSNTITENAAPNHGGGGIYCSDGASPAIADNIIADNTAKYDGGGIFCFGHGCSATITNNIIADNTVTTDHNFGGGGICCYSCSATITNNTITGNSSWSGAVESYGASATLTNCIVWGNLGYQIHGDVTASYSDVQAGYPGVGNIDLDPRFVDPRNWDDGGYHLLPDSPCIDAGIDAGVYTDMEGNLRPFDFPGVDNNGPLPEFDMGAYEAIPEPSAMVLLGSSLLALAGLLATRKTHRQGDG